MAFVVLVTGASRGIGRSIAVSLAVRGATVAVHYGSSAPDAAATIALMASEHGQQHAAFGADLTDTSQCKGLIEAVVEKYGRLDVLVNNAGVSVDYDDLLAVSYEEFQHSWEKTIALNTLAACRLSFLAIRQFVAQAEVHDAVTESHMQRLSHWFGKGRIVNVSSRAAYAGDVTAAAYAASKSGLNVWQTSMAQVVAKDGVFIYNVAPGAVKTDMWLKVLSPTQLEAMEGQCPLRRLGDTAEVAVAVEFMALDAPPLMTGTTTDVNGATYLR